MVSGPCEVWPVILCCDTDGVSAAVTGSAAMAATEVMWGLSGRQFGTCTVPLRPCRQECAQTERYLLPGYADNHWPYPALVGGLWYNLGCGGSCTTDCSCNTVSQFTLPRPVIEITQITIDDVPLATGSYRVDNGRYVVRTDGGEWPLCNDLSKDSGEGTWTVVVKYGAPVPHIGLLAAGELACEFMKACTDDNTCRLPKRVQTLTRQGVTMAFLDPQEFLADGLTGMYLPDLFLSTVNPNKLKQPSMVYSPDIPRPRYRTS